MTTHAGGRGGWTRRRFLGTTALAALGLAASARVARPASSRGARKTPATPGHGGEDDAALVAIRADLGPLVTTRALEVDDPWVLMHAVLGLGREARHGGEPVVDYVTRTWLGPVTSGGKQWPAFPRKTEAHPNHFLQIMYATGVPADHPFATRMGTVTRADLLRGAQALFSPAMEGDELSWTVSVLSAELRPEADRFENAEGRAFTVGAVIEAAVQAAEAGYAETLAAMRGAKPYERSAIQGYACNGTHVIYGLLDALRNGYRGNRLAERTTALMQAALYRLGPEVELIDRVIGAGGEPTAQLNADAAKLQFLGHSIENLAFARRHGLYTPTATELSAVRRAEEALAAITHRLVRVHDLDALARQVPKAYGLILGDACHALHAVAREPA